jgi:hypothetical protein
MVQLVVAPTTPTRTVNVPCVAPSGIVMDVTPLPFCMKEALQSLDRYTAIFAAAGAVSVAVPEVSDMLPPTIVPGETTTVEMSCAFAAQIGIRQSKKNITIRIERTTASSRIAPSK